MSALLSGSARASSALSTPNPKAPTKCVGTGTTFLPLVYSSSSFRALSLASGGDPAGRVNSVVWIVLVFLGCQMMLWLWRKRVLALGGRQCRCQNFGGTVEVWVGGGERGGGDARAEFLQGMKSSRFT